MNYFITKDGVFYAGTLTEGAREATADEILTHLGDPLTNARKAKQHEIDNAYDQEINKLCNGATLSEKMTWTIQGQEAKAWAKDKNADTSNLDKIALNRGEDRIHFIEKTLAKTLAYEDISFTLTGKKQRYEDIIKVASLEELEKIQWQD